MNLDRTSTECVNITADGIYRWDAHSGRALSTFKVNVKQTKSPKFRFRTRRLTVFKRIGQYLNH